MGGGGWISSGRIVGDDPKWSAVELTDCKDDRRGSFGERFSPKEPYSDWSSEVVSASSSNDSMAGSVVFSCTLEALTRCRLFSEDEMFIDSDILVLIDSGDRLWNKRSPRPDSFGCSPKFMGRDDG